MGQWTVEEPKNVKWFEEKTSDIKDVDMVIKFSGEEQVLMFSFRAITAIGRTFEDKICYRFSIEGKNRTNVPVGYTGVITPQATAENGQTTYKTANGENNPSPYDFRTGTDTTWFSNTWTALTVGGKGEAEKIYYVLDSIPPVDSLIARGHHTYTYGGRTYNNYATTTYSIPQHYGNQLWLPTSDGWKRAQLWVPVDGTWKMGFFKPKIEGDWK